MLLVPFAKFFPELAFDECRFLFLVPDRPGTGPDDAEEQLALIEHYCADPTCDCRRVMLEVVSEAEGGPLCSISFGFDRDAIDSGPFIDPLNPTAPFADEVLELVEHTVLSDPAYVARLERHYRMVKDVVRGRRVILNGEQAREVIAEKRRRLRKRRRALKRK
jgi:hypothetical protein